MRGVDTGLSCSNLETGGFAWHFHEERSNFEVGRDTEVIGSLVRVLAFVNGICPLHRLEKGGSIPTCPVMLHHVLNLREVKELVHIAF